MYSYLINGVEKLLHESFFVGFEVFDLLGLRGDEVPPPIFGQVRC